MSTRAKIFWAFAAVYLIWGSTYLGIQIAVRTMPPFLLAAVRFFTAGTLIYAWARLNGEPNPPPAVWRMAALLGTLFFVLGNGLVVWAEQRVPSGKTALLASTSPIWTVLLESAIAKWKRPPNRVILGVALGFSGLLLLAAPGGSASESVSWTGLLALLLASFAWALGSVYAHHRHLPASPAMATGMKMIGGGLQLAVVGFVAGDWHRLTVTRVSWQAWAALAYLIVFGSIIAFTAFTFLLRVTTPQTVNTSSYVNPLVAVFLGWALAGETVTGRMFVGALVIVTSVLLIRSAGAPNVAEPAEVGTLDTGEFPIPDRPA
jgi:drug/metabolite transporter (DMT)-like permease